MVSSNRGRAVVLATCIGAFCAAMGLRAEVSVWIGTGSAASLSLLLLWFGARPSARAVVGPKPLAGLLVGIAVGVAMSFATWGLYPIAVELLPEVGTDVLRATLSRCRAKLIDGLRDLTHVAFKIALPLYIV